MIKAMSPLAQAIGILILIAMALSLPWGEILVVAMTVAALAIAFAATVCGLRWAVMLNGAHRKGGFRSWWAGSRSSKSSRRRSRRRLRLRP